MQMTCQAMFLIAGDNRPRKSFCQLILQLVAQLAQALILRITMLLR